MSYLSLGGDEQIYYEDTGKGDRTAVLLHGWSSSHEVFDPVVKKLRKKARFVVPDQRGHGKSRDMQNTAVTLDTLAYDLHLLIRSLGLKDITLVGWSMGAAVCMRYMAEYGCEKLRQAVLCDMSPKQLNDERWHLGLDQGQYTRKNMEEDTGKDFYSVYRRFVLSTIPKLEKVPEPLLRQPLYRELAGCNEEILKSLALSMKLADLREDVEKIAVPVTYFYADPGSLFSPALAVWYREHVRTPYRSVIFPASTHMLVSDHPYRFASELMKVIGETADGGDRPETEA